MNNNTYVIIPTIELTDTMVEASMNTPNSIRYNTIGTKCILKFNTKFPDVTKGYIKYTHSEILVELQNEEWI